MAAVAARFMDKIMKVKPSWSPSDVLFSQITCACSNTIFRVSSGRESVLLRIYGSTAHGLFTRTDEIDRAAFLAERGFGPRMLDTFEEGRIESWLEGRTPSNEAIRSPAAIRAIAKKLKTLHSKTGINHNDLHHNNMLFMKDGRVEFLDFEYADSVDTTYDIANHFNEWMYPYDGPNPHLYRPELYPSQAQRREFCEAYLGDTSGKGAFVEDFMQEIESRRADSHRFWVEWAERTPNEFNDLYAMARRELLENSE